MRNVMRTILILVFVSIVSIVLTLPVSAEDIEETAKYKAPTMDQTLDFIQRMTTGTLDFKPEECILITSAVKK